MAGLEKRASLFISRRYLFKEPERLFSLFTGDDGQREARMNDDVLAYSGPRG
jgi:hypothetical protein